MKNLLKKIRKSNKGFTLVELIIVIAIIAILVAVLAPQYIRYVGQSRDAVIEAAANDVASVAKAELALGHLEGAGDISVEAGATPALGTGLTFDDTEAGYTWDTVVGGAVQDNQSDATFTITITDAGVVTVAED